MVRLVPIVHCCNVHRIAWILPNRPDISEHAESVLLFQKGRPVIWQSNDRTGPAIAPVSDVQCICWLLNVFA